MRQRSRTPTLQATLAYDFADRFAKKNHRHRDAAMLPFIRFAFWLLAKLILPLRYRLIVDGDEELRDVTGPAPILPSHPAFVDPLLVLMVLWRALETTANDLREQFSQSPALSLDESDQRRAGAGPRTGEHPSPRQAEKAVAEVIAGLRAGYNHVLWPSGRLQCSGVERLGAARSVADILQAVPEATVILVRTSGLWGSRFSYGYAGERPSLVGGLFVGFGLLLSNLLFLMPRREIHMTVRRVARTELPELRRETLNPWLEFWYNAGGPERPTFVPYHFLLGPRTHEFPALPTMGEADLSRVKAVTKDAVAQIVAERLDRALIDAEQTPRRRLMTWGWTAWIAWN